MNAPLPHDTISVQCTAHRQHDLHYDAPSCLLANARSIDARKPGRGTSWYESEWWAFQPYREDVIGPVADSVSAGSRDAERTCSPAWTGAVAGQCASEAHFKSLDAAARLFVCGSQMTLDPNNQVQAARFALVQGARAKYTARSHAGDAPDSDSDLVLHALDPDVFVSAPEGGDAESQQQLMRLVQWLRADPAFLYLARKGPPQMARGIDRCSITIPLGDPVPLSTSRSVAHFVDGAQIPASASSTRQDSNFIPTPEATHRMAPDHVSARIRAAQAILTARCPDVDHASTTPWSFELKRAERGREGSQVSFMVPEAFDRESTPDVGLGRRDRARGAVRRREMSWSEILSETAEAIFFQ